MKKFTLLLLLLTSLTFVNAQSSIGLHMGVGLSHSLAPLRSAAAKDFFSVSPGFDFQHKLSNRFSLYTGVGVLTISEKMNVDNLRWGSEVDGLGNYVRNPSLPHELKMKHLVSFISVPIGVKYYINQTGFRFFVSTYIEANIFIGNRIASVEYLDNGRIHSRRSISEQVINPRSVAFGTGIGVGVEKNIGKHFSLYLMPDFKLLFTDTTTADVSKSIVSSMRLGVFYKL